MRNLTGTVVSVKPALTAIVRVDGERTHRLYRKKYRVSQRFAAHDPERISAVGDVVAITETRPISRTKQFRVDRVIKKAEELR